MSTYDRIRAIAPPLSDATDEELSTFVDFALQRVHPNTWGHLHGQGVVYLAAHLATRAAAQLADNADKAEAIREGGEVQGVKTKDLSVTYGQTSVSASAQVSMAHMAYTSTPYGREYVALKALIGGGPVIV